MSKKQKIISIIITISFAFCHDCQTAWGFNTKVKNIGDNMDMDIIFDMAEKLEGKMNENELIFEEDAVNIITNYCNKNCIDFEIEENENFFMCDDCYNSIIIRMRRVCGAKTCP
jgi:hypothetical protein